MSRIFSIRHGLVVVLVVVLLAGACTDSQSENGTDDGQSGAYSATITRTTDGVPHIVGDTVGDVTFGQGYASAEDYLCTLADQIVRVNSERAKYHGSGEEDENINSKDFGWLHLGVRERAEEDLDAEPQEARELLQGFVAGWNTYLEETGTEDVPGWCAGEPWVQPITELDLYTYARSVTMMASGGQLVDFIATAQPPGSEEAEEGGEGETALGLPEPESMGSNGWAIGAERTEDGTAMLVANPHFPWEGPLRFWESHLTVPGEYDIYGAQLAGLPGVGIGFSDEVAWTHTVSAGSRFTAYFVNLADGDATTYLYDDEPRPMESTAYTIDVAGEDGTTAPMTRTLWSTHYGPVLDFPGVGWTEDLTFTYRDANVDNTAFLSQYLEMNRAESLDDLIAAHEEHNGVPLFNTMAASADGRVWYADTSATPNLSPEAIDWWLDARETNLLVSTAWENRAVLLDGGDSSFEWVDVEGARSPGLVPFDEQPQVLRDDYVFNANDSYWLTNVEEPIVGDYSPLHGEADTPRSPRTRENARVLTTVDGSVPSGDGGLFTIDELRDTILLNQGHTAYRLRDDVVERCRQSPTVEVESVTNEDGEEQLAGGTVDLSAACELLAGWDGLVELDSVGAVIWREFVSQYSGEELRDGAPLWQDEFDPTDPVGTPAGLAPAPDGPDPALVNLGRAVQIIEAAGIQLDASLGDVQFAERADVTVPIHGGTGAEGVPNIVGWSGSSGSTEPTPEHEALVPGSRLTADGYPINVGTSFLMTLEFTDDGPVAYAILTYGETEDRDDELFSVQTQRFSDKDWRPIVRTEDDIASDAERTYTVSG